MKKYLVPVILLIVTFALIYLLFRYKDFFKKPSLNPASVPTATSVEENISDSAPRVAILAQNLEIPWSLVFLPDKSILLTERPGRVRLFKGGKLDGEPVYTVPDVKHIGEGGLLGITTHPKFSENHFVYIYYTYSAGANTQNRVVRFKFDGKSFSDRRVIVDGIPGAVNHNGGRIKFGPDGFLYITTGDAQQQSQAQEKNSLAGKILRVTDEGTTVADNPFGNAVYSYGHRNPQGLSWDDKGRLWETEHGPSGTWPNCCQDELNLVEKGANYGWPDSVGDKVQSGTKAPVLHSGRDSWAPSGLSFLNGNLYFTGLRGAVLMQVGIGSEKIERTENFKNEFGRLRDVVVGPDGLLYILTNNRDGRGRPADGDDKIIVVNPKKL